MSLQDGHFVPNLTLGAPIVKSLRKHTDSFLDCHLMVSNPAQWIKVGKSSCVHAFHGKSQHGLCSTLSAYDEHLMMLSWLACTQG